LRIDAGSEDKGRPRAGFGGYEWQIGGGKVLLHDEGLDAAIVYIGNFYSKAEDVTERRILVA
jgi:hypothetical protein